MLAARRAAASLRRAPLRSFAAQTKATYNWADPMNLNAQLTEDERMFRDSAHAFCQQELQPTILKVRTRIAFGTGARHHGKQQGHPAHISRRCYRRTATSTSTQG